MARAEPRQGAHFGKWELVEWLGAGGNGNVWKARARTGELGAIKLLHSRYAGKERHNQRLRDEIEAMRACADIAGVLPLLDSWIPANPSRAAPAWLVSAYAVPLDNALAESAALREIVSLCLSLARTLAAMHGRGYSHRDIKPENIFLYEDVWCVGDFGLVDFPGKIALTREGEKLGPTYYIAPEMLNQSHSADGLKADVFSLGKLFWKLAAGQRFPVGGVHHREIPALTISGNVRGEATSGLDALLEAMTQLDPALRPPMLHVAEALSLWLAPPPAASRTTDLSPYTRRVEALTDTYSLEQERRKAIQAKADSERGRAFKIFAPVMAEIKDELDRAKIGRVAIEAPSGGNGEFYHAVTGNHSVGRGDDRTWLYQFPVTARITAGSKWAELKCGVNLGVRNVEGDPDTLHDLFAPVLAAVGYIVTTHLLVGGSWRSEPHLVWGDADTFYFGQPTEAAVLNRLAVGLASNLSRGVEDLIASFEGLDASTK
jgi:hypothetical protein